MRATAVLLCGTAVALVMSCSDRSGEPTGTPPLSAAPLASAGPSTERFCSAVREALPDRLGSLRRRTSVTPRVDGWGEPPVVLRCGVPPVARPPGDTTRLLVAGIAWYSEDIADDVRWTTLELPVPVEVVVPADYEGQLLAQLAEPLREALSASRSRAP